MQQSPDQQQNPQQANQKAFALEINTIINEAAGEPVTSRNLLDEIMYYVTPIIGFAAFILILIFGIIPSFSSMSDKMAAIDDLKFQDDALRQRIINLDKIKNNLSDLEQVIDGLNSIVPEGTTEVVHFSQNIRSAINQNMDKFNTDNTEAAIKMNSIKTGELTLASTNDTSSSSLKINQIPTEFTFTGGFNRFRQFFTNLYSGSDFFVVEKMQLSFNTIDKNWTGDVSLVKYQFNVENDFDANLVYGAVSESAIPNAKVIDFLQTKFLGNKTSEATQTN